MTGVEILATQEVVTTYAFNWSVYLIAIALITSLMTLMSCLNDGFNFCSVVVGLAVGVVFGIILGLAPATTFTPSEYETRYKVIISDEVSMNEFLNKYEIIDQEGKIYTVREIE